MHSEYHFLCYKISRSLIDNQTAILKLEYSIANNKKRRSLRCFTKRTVFDLLIKNASKPLRPK